mgnify:CR=1 FL=1
MLTQILVQNARREQEYVPRLFAQYIAYTDSYMRNSEAYAQQLTEVFSRYIQVSTHEDFMGDLWDYISQDFIPGNPLPVIITDRDAQPTLWNKVGVSQDTTFSELSGFSQRRLYALLSVMERIPMVDQDQLTGYAYFRKPLSFEDFITKIDQSIVVTDRAKKPLYWRNIGMAENEHYSDFSPEAQQMLRDKMAVMKEIPLNNEADSLGYIYFSAPKSLSYIRYFVFLELFVAVFLILMGSYGLMLVKRTEKDTLWIGLAKETAHQFGTPITSLMGWIAYLREQPEGSGSKEQTEKIIDFMTADLNHLKNIASRFGKVGSMTKLVPTDLHLILSDTVDYFSNRMPHLGARIDIHLISKIEGLKVMLDSELIKWTLENLIKNCVDAMTGKGGNIIITATHKDPWIYIHIRDEGKGIARGQWKKVFEPGVTTKARGWGLGLSLAKRIIEEYHQGHIRVVESTLGEGTTFEIKLHTETHRGD